MISVNDLKPGTTFIYEDKIYIVYEYSHSKSGRGQAHVKLKVKNLRSNAIITLTFTGGEKVKKAYIEQTILQFLYEDGKHIIFMNNKTYDQIEVPLSQYKDYLLFLKEGSNVTIRTFEKEILDIILPVNIILEVTSVEAAIKGDSANGATKKATLETGLKIAVPLFIKAGEKIIVSTIDKKYVGRA